MRRKACSTIVLATAAALLPAGEAAAKYCPRVLYRATRLIMVSVPTMQSTVAHVRTFERVSPASAWEPRSTPEPAVVGMRGIAWGDIYASLAKKDEPVKREGDHRTPAGVYRISATFGAEDTKLSGHLTLMPAKQFCVEDASSRFYGKIVPQSVAGEKTSGEDMATYPLYRRGLVIDYPPRPKDQAGSCIFLHVWGGLEAGTEARIGLPEDRVAYFQDWAARRFTAIASCPRIRSIASTAVCPTRPVQEMPRWYLFPCAKARQCSATSADWPSVTSRRGHRGSSRSRRR